MKIICFSDLHLEFEEPFTPPAEDIADVMILAGDVSLPFRISRPLSKSLRLGKSLFCSSQV